MTGNLTAPARSSHQRSARGFLAHPVDLFIGPRSDGWLYGMDTTTLDETAMTDREASDDFEVVHEGMMLCPYDPATFPTAEAVIEDMGQWADDFSITERFEVWRGGVMVATARFDEASGRYIPGPPFDRTRGMPAIAVEAFDKFFPGVLDNPGPSPHRP